MSVATYHLSGRLHSESIRNGDAGAFEVVTIDDLKVDHSYQRDLDVNLVQGIAKEWDIAAAGPIVVARRGDGSLFVVNGQHRAAGAKTAGEAEIIAQVIDLSNVPIDEARKLEAELRLKGNTRRGDKVQERFRAQLAAGYKESLALVEIAREFGTRINPWPDPKHGINCVSTLEGLYRKDRGGHLVRVLEFVREAFGNVDGPTSVSALLSGVSWLLERHDNELDRKRMVERLSVETLDGLLRQARSHKAAMGGSLWMNVYRAMIGIYNERLPESKRLAWRTSTPSKDARDSMERAANARSEAGHRDPED